MTTKCNICDVTTGQGSDYIHHRCTEEHIDVSICTFCAIVESYVQNIVQKEKHDHVSRLLEYVESLNSLGSSAPPMCRLCGCTLQKSDEDMLIHVLGKRHQKNFNEREHKDERLAFVPLH